MRIAFIYDAVFPYIKGGAERLFAELGQRMTPRHEIHIFGMKFWDGPADRQIGENLWLHGICRALPMYQAGRRSIRQALWFTTSIPWALLRQGHFDIIHVMSIPYFPIFLLRPFCRLRRSRFVTTWLEFWHGHWAAYLGGRGAAIAEWIEWLAARCSTTVVTISRHTTAGLIQAGVPERNITLIPPGIDWGALQAVAPGEERADVLFVGRLVRDKRVDLLLEAVARAIRRRPDLSCRIVGDGPERAELEAQAARLGLGGNVRFLGFLKDSADVYRLMKSSRVFAFLSEREGFGIVLVEAAACGVPAITVDAPNNAGAQLVRDGGNGFVCPPEPGAVAERMEQLLADEGLRLQLAGRGREWSRGYDWPVIVEKLDALYQKIC